MTRTPFAVLAIVCLLLAIAGCQSSSADASQPESPAAENPATELAQAPGETASPPTFQMTTEVPPGIATPDAVETRIGTLRFTDGYPDEETARLVYEQLNFQRGVEAMMLTTAGGSLHAFREGIRELGPDNETAIIWADRMDSKVILLTPNTTVVYLFMWLDTHAGPLVIESPPNVLGIIDDFWFNYVADLGRAGPDAGAGGNFLLLPPGYEGDVPDGYYVTRSNTYGNWFVLRGYLVDGDPAPAVENMQTHLRVYPLAEADSPPDLNIVDVSGRFFNTVHATDFSFFEAINEIVQEEPNAAQNPEILGILASIGIEKGREFNPDDRMRATLTEAAAVGTAAARSIVYRSREEAAPAYPDSGWETGFIAGSHQFLREGVRLLDQRVRFHYFATGITPAMVTPHVGQGSQYMMGLRDSEGRPFDGGQNYRLHIPPDVPARDFWEVTIYDVQTRSMLQTDQRFPGITSEDAALQQNDDGSWDIYFGPTAPAGREGNWLQTIPGKGWHMLWRIYGPLEPWFDGSWRPGETVLVD